MWLKTQLLNSHFFLRLKTWRNQLNELDAWLFAIIFLAIVARIFWLEIPKFEYGDLGRDLLVARKMSENGLQFIAPFSGWGFLQNTPLYYWFISLSRKLTNSIAGIELTSFFTGLLVIFATYKAGIQISRRFGLLATALVATNYWMVFTTTHTWQPYYLPLFTVTSLWAALKNEFDGYQLKTTIIGLVSIVVGVLWHYSFLLLAPVFLFYFFKKIYQNSQKPVRDTLVFYSILLIGLISWLAMMMKMHPQGLGLDFDTLQERTSWEKKATIESWGKYQQLIVSHYSLVSENDVLVVLSIFPLFLVILGQNNLPMKMKRVRKIILSIFSILPILLLLETSRLSRHYLLPFLPLYSFLFAVAVYYQKKLGRLLASVVVSMVLIFNTIYIFTNIRNEIFHYNQLQYDYVGVAKIIWTDTRIDSLGFISFVPPDLGWIQQGIFDDFSAMKIWDELEQYSGQKFITLNNHVNNISVPANDIGIYNESNEKKHGYLVCYYKRLHECVAELDPELDQEIGRTSKLIIYRVRSREKN